MPPKIKREKRIPTDEEVRKLLEVASIERRQDELPIILAAFGSLRRGERFIQIRSMMIILRSGGIMFWMSMRNGCWKTAPRVVRAFGMFRFRQRLLKDLRNFQKDKSLVLILMVFWTHSQYDLRVFPRYNEESRPFWI